MKTREYLKLNERERLFLKLSDKLQEDFPSLKIECFNDTFPLAKVRVNSYFICFVNFLNLKEDFYGVYKEVKHRYITTDIFIMKGKERIKNKQ